MTTARDIPGVELWLCETFPFSFSIIFLDVYSFSIGRTMPFDCQVIGHSLEGA